jgi:hypothetical protein
VDPQFVLLETSADGFDDDGTLSIGNPGPIDMVTSDGSHRIVSGGSSAHESIVIRTRSSQLPSTEDSSPIDLTSVDGIDAALCSKFLVKASSSCIKAGLAVEPTFLPYESSAGSSHSSPDIARADEVLEYLRSFTVNEDDPSHPFLRSPAKTLPIDAIRAIIHRSQQLFAEEPRVLAVPEDVRVFSDIHGNFKDLLVWQRLFWPDGVAKLQGGVLWLGDYVDRGLNSVEVLLYMLAQKVFVIHCSWSSLPPLLVCCCKTPSFLISSQVKNPSKWLMLRGNHEARLMNGWVEHYGVGSFKNLCLKVENAAGLFPNELWLEFNAVFDHLPLAAVSVSIPFPLQFAFRFTITHPRFRSFKLRYSLFMEVSPDVRHGIRHHATVQPSSLATLHTLHLSAALQEHTLQLARTLLLLVLP